MLYVSPYDYINRNFGFSDFRANPNFPSDALHRFKKDATTLEEYFYFKTDWDLVPASIHTSPRETNEEVRVTPSGSWADFFVDGIHTMLAKTDIDGFFFDIDNPMLNLDEEKGLAYQTKDGKEEGTAEMFALRDMYKRLYYVFDAARGEKRKPYIIGHGFPAAAPYMSFWDCTVNGEEVKPEKPFDLTRIFLQKRLQGNPVALSGVSDLERSYDAFAFRCIYGAQFGLPNIHLPQYGYKPELNVREHARETLSFTFPHNTLVWAAYLPAEPVYDFWSKVEVPFGLGDTVFYPYWENKIVAEPACIRVSYWKKEVKSDYLLSVSNWSEQEVRAKITLPVSLNAYQWCVDMEKQERISVDKFRQMAIPGHDLRVFRFTD